MSDSPSKLRRSPAVVGAMTVFTVLLVLCVTVFTVLTVVSADADLRMSRKSADTAVAYYAADTRAACLVAAFAHAYADTGDASEACAALTDYGDCAVSAAIEGGVLVLSASVPVDERRTLDIRVRFGDAPVRESWRLRGATDGTVEIDDGLPVWKG